MYRAKTYNEATWHQMVPVHRMDVVPGQSINLSASIRVRSIPFKRLLLSGGQIMAATFYTPYRLLWDNWVEYVTERVGVTGTEDNARVPELDGKGVWPFLFESGSVTNRNVFGRRAYKLIYNQFFGSQQWSDGAATWYDDIATDDEVTVKRTRNLDQFLSRLVEKEDVYDKIWTLPTDGATVDINLNDLRNQLVRARSMRRQDMTGDKYVDRLARMGVKLDWRVQNAPELLSLNKIDCDPKILAATNIVAEAEAGNSETLGQAAAYFDSTIQHRTGKKYFAEHGVVWTVLVFKPHVWFEGDRGSRFSNMVTWNQFFWGDNVGGILGNVTAQSLGAGGTDDAWVPFWEATRSGHNLMGNRGAAPWVFAESASPTDIGGLVYPNVTRGMVTDTGIGAGNTFCFLADVMMGQHSPIPSAEKNT